MRIDSSYTFKSFMGKLLIFILLLGFVIFIFHFICYPPKEERLNYDFNDYLTWNTDFKRNIETILPTTEDLLDSKIVNYFYYNDGGKDDIISNQMIRLTVEYPDESFVTETKELEQKVLQTSNKSDKCCFYYNGVLYNAFTFHNNGYCAIAYNICQTSKTISYIAIDCWDLEFMDMASALSIFPKIDYEDQVVKVKDYSLSLESQNS